MLVLVTERAPILNLGYDFFDEVHAAHFPEHILRYRNPRWASQFRCAGVNFTELTDEAWISYFGTFRPLNLNPPLALRYHGHQFQHYNPQLGDGRGFLFAQGYDKQNRLLDLGTKGSGTTPYSRGGDGRLTLKGGVREVLASAMLEALGVPTSNAFSLIETGESLVRYDEPSPTRSSVLVRLSHSHIRFGSFQYHAYHRHADNIAKLCHYCIEHYAPHINDAQGSQLIALWFEHIVRQSAITVASWMIAGFVHGVLNTDNMNITGESFDYGPYRFLPHYDPSFTAAYFDEVGLYAYARQPSAVLWNLCRLAEALAVICPMQSLTPALGNYELILERVLSKQLCWRLGLNYHTRYASSLFEACFAVLAEYKGMLSFEDFFFDHVGGLARAKQRRASPRAKFYRGENYNNFAQLLEHFTPTAIHTHSYWQQQSPCTLVIDEIETIWTEIDRNDNWQLFTEKLTALETLRQAYTYSN